MLTRTDIAAFGAAIDRAFPPSERNLHVIAAGSPRLKNITGISPADLPTGEEMVVVIGRRAVGYYRWSEFAAPSDENGNRADIQLAESHVMVGKGHSRYQKWVGDYKTAFDARRAIIREYARINYNAPAAAESADAKHPAKRGAFSERIAAERARGENAERASV